MPKSYIGSVAFIDDVSDLMKNIGHTGDITFLINDELEIEAQYVKLEKDWRKVNTGSGGSEAEIEKIKEKISLIADDLIAAKGKLIILDQDVSIINEKIERKIIFDTKFNFPTIGNPESLYIDKSQNRLYRWDDDEQKYIKLGAEADDADWHNIEIIDGGNA